MSTEIEFSNCNKHTAQLKQWIVHRSHDLRRNKNNRTCSDIAQFTDTPVLGHSHTSIIIEFSFQSRLTTCIKRPFMNVKHNLLYLYGQFIIHKWEMAFQIK